MKQIVEQLLLPELRERNCPVPFSAIEKCALFLDELMKANRSVNLCGYKTSEEILVNLFLDSLAPVFLDLDFHGPLLDLGTGAGFPGIPIRLTRPAISVTLLDCRKKKLDFLERAMGAIGEEGLMYLWGRAEDLAHTVELREAFGVVTAKAIGSMSEILELSLPFLRRGGLLIAYKGERFQEEVDGARRALHILGGEYRCAMPYRLPGIDETRHLVVVQKKSASPATYPRRPGLPHSQPL